jgi:hypothetical protein
VRGKVNPKTQVQKTEPGAPSALRWFVMGRKFASPIDTRFWMTSLSSGAPGMLKSERKGQTQDPGSKTRTWGTLRVMVVGEEQKTFSSDLHSCLR